VSDPRAARAQPNGRPTQLTPPRPTDNPAQLTNTRPRADPVLPRAHAARRQEWERREDEASQWHAQPPQEEVDHQWADRERGWVGVGEGNAAANAHEPLPPQQLGQPRAAGGRWSAAAAAPFGNAMNDWEQ
jgi:hypothetical protein